MPRVPSSLWLNNTHIVFIRSSVTETQIRLPIPWKTSIQEMSFGGKGIGALFRRRAPWGEGGLLSQSPLLVSAGRRDKGLNQRREYIGLRHFLLMCRLGDVSCRVILVLGGCARSSSFLVPRGGGQLSKEVWFLGTQRWRKSVLFFLQRRARATDVQRERKLTYVCDLKKEKHFDKDCWANQKAKAASNRLAGLWGLGKFWSFIPQGQRSANLKESQLILLHIKGLRSASKKCATSTQVNA